MKFTNVDQTSSAVLSPCGRYRYSLTRQWGPVEPGGRPYILWIMLNPSTADHLVNDPTIRRCISFSKEWGYNRMVVANLFALRSTDPRKLKEHPDPVGPENNRILHNLIFDADKVVCAWGNNVPPKERHAVNMSQDEYITLLVKSHINPLKSEPGKVYEKTAYCLGVTKQGQPRHPLYLKQNQKLEEYKPEIKRGTPKRKY